MIGSIYDNKVSIEYILKLYCQKFCKIRNFSKSVRDMKGSECQYFLISSFLAKNCFEIHLFERPGLILLNSEESTSNNPPEREHQRFYQKYNSLLK